MNGLGATCVIHAELRSYLNSESSQVTIHIYLILENVEILENWFCVRFQQDIEAVSRLESEERDPDAADVEMDVPLGGGESAAIPGPSGASDDEGEAGKWVDWLLVVPALRI